MKLKSRLQGHNRVKQKIHFPRSCKIEKAIYIYINLETEEAFHRKEIVFNRCFGLDDAWKRMTEQEIILKGNLKNAWQIMHQIQLLHRSSFAVLNSS